jgi:hypothetical protein
LEQTLSNFPDDNEGMFPPPAICSKDGKPLLSWRVAILPYLREGKLYKQFKLDEPWDGPHNKKLLASMPKFYAPVGVETKERYATFYQAIVGPGAAWEFKPKAGIRFNAEGLRWNGDFTDGRTNTIGVVEAAKSVPWTKPEDVPYRPKGQLPKLGGLFKAGSTSPSWMGVCNS